ncbi:hypothetical protein Sjap_015108 [Stephania japonica]|uniref:Myb-like protein L n=1 Tax=Stephania japonica TaxID=461633 RepID=A0AAP0IK36_9MAGN
MAIHLQRGEIKDASDDASDEEDREAFRRACVLAGTNPSEVNAEAVLSDSEGSDFDDIEFARSVQLRFSIPSENVRPMLLKPLRALPPGASDDEEDDFETLRAIERRFSKYNSDSLKRNSECSLDKPDLNCGSITTSNPETRKELDEESPRFEEAPVTPQPRESLADSNLRNQSCSPIEWHCAESYDESTSPSKYSSLCNAKYAQMFIDAIKRNRSCQRFIRGKLIQLEARIEENKKLKERFKLIRDYQVSCKKRIGQPSLLRKDPHIRLIQARKSKNSQTSKVNDKKVRASHSGPIENSHVANYRKVSKQYSLPLCKQKWSKAEKESLEKGIKQQYQEMLLEKSLEVLSASDEYSGDSNAFDDAIASVTNFEITPERLRAFLPIADWEQLASTYLTGRSGAECKARWINSEDPLINHNQWTNIEDKNLLFILQQRGLYNWVDIASSLGTNRTPFQCLTRFQRSLNAFIMKRDWTEDDDSQLRAAVEAFGEHDWQMVASYMEGRAGTQCSNRWNKSLNPKRDRVGRWTVEEDKCLKVSVTLFGAKAWNKIAQFVPGRTQVQCRERWLNVLDPSLNLGEWTGEEDAKLKEAITKYGHCWSKIAACVPPRTDNQCRRRWKVLLPHEVPLLQAARRLQKVALISNFVDREEERPALGPGDFLPLPWGDSVPADENGGESIPANENGEVNVESDEKMRAKSKSKKRKDSSCGASTKKSSRHRGSKRQKTSQATEVNDEVENLERGEAVLSKRKTCKPRSKDKCAESAASKEDLQFSSKTVAGRKACKSHSKKKCAESATGDQDLQLLPETDLKRKASKPNVKSNCAESTNVNRKTPSSFEPSTFSATSIIHDNLIQVENKGTSKRQTKGDKFTNKKGKIRESSLSSDDSYSLYIPDDDDATNRKKRKTHMQRSRKGSSTAQFQVCHETTTENEQSAFDSTDNALNGMSTVINVHPESQFGQSVEDATNSEEIMETNDEEGATLSSFLENNGRKRRCKIPKNTMTTSTQVPFPRSKKHKRIKLPQAAQDFSVHNKQSACDRTNVASNGADISPDGTAGDARCASHFNENIETEDRTTLASFLRKKKSKRSAGAAVERDRTVSPT